VLHRHHAAASQSRISQAAEFWSVLDVSPDVLVAPETELLVELVLERIPTNARLSNSAPVPAH
jgi:methylase of polypeptide subunit release factors